MTPRVAWERAPARPRADGSEVHVWAAALDVAPAAVSRLRGHLCAEERARARRFRFNRDRDRYVVGRAVLRRILGAYLDRAPGEVELHYGDRGKPAAAREGEPGIRFNVAHSGGLALYAVTLARETGIDVEEVRPGLESETIAGRLFSPDDAAALRAAPAEDRVRVFLEGWTRMEALAKGRGCGLSGAGGGPGCGTGWVVQSMIPAPGYVAALAVEGPGAAVRFWLWPEWDGVPLPA